MNNQIFITYVNNAQNIWEFAVKNRSEYTNIQLNKIYYLMTPFYLNNKIDNKIKNNFETIYDVFFYGLENKRRKDILNKLSEIFNIKIGFRIYGKARDDIIIKSKIIINLHYYDDCALESCRLNEILQYNKIIISEKPSESDWYNQSLYNNIVDFVDIINPDSDFFTIYIYIYINGLSRKIFKV